MYLPPGGLVTFTLTPTAGFSGSGLEALAVVPEIHFLVTNTTRQAHKFRARKAPMRSFGILDIIVPLRDSSANMILAIYLVQDNKKEKLCCSQKCISQILGSREKKVNKVHLVHVQSGHEVDPDRPYQNYTL